MISFFVVRYRIYWMLLAAHVALYADSWHFVMPPLVSLQKDVWETDAEIPHWWHVTTQIWVVLLIGWKFASTNQSEALLRSGQWRIISIKFLQSFLRHHFEEPEVTWQNGGCFVRPLSQAIKTSWKIQKKCFFRPQPLKHKWLLSSEVMSVSDRVLVMDFMKSILCFIAACS